MKKISEKDLPYQQLIGTTGQACASLEEILKFVHDERSINTVATGGALMLLTVLTPPDWLDEYEDYRASKSKFVKHKNGVPIEIEFITDGPEKREFTKDGKVITSWNFPVRINEGGKIREKISSITSDRLMSLIINEAKKAPLKGRKFTITASGDGLNRVWTMVEVKA